MTTASKTRDGYRDLPLAAISPNPNQPRKRFDTDALIELSESIKQHGLIQPITVRPFEDGFQIIAGERRWRAAALAGLTAIPTRVMNVDDETTMVMAITENVARRDMDPMEEAGAYAELVKLGKTTTEIAQLFGKSENMVKWSISLLNLTEQAQWLVAKRHISFNVGCSLANLSPAGQQAALNRIQGGDFADNDAILRHCAVVQKVEAQGDGFFAGLIESDPITEARRSARRNELETAWEKVEKFAASLTPFLEAEPEDLAFALGANITTYASKLAVLAGAVNRVRNDVRQAAAIAKVVLAEEEA